MHEDIIAELISQALGIVLEVAFAFWIEIVSWVAASVLAWIQTELGPLVASSVTIAFFSLGQVAEASYYTIKQAWETLRQFLLEALVEFEQSSDSPSTWARRLTSTLIKVLNSNQPVIVKREIEEQVDWDGLPADVRAAWLRSSQRNYKVDFVQMRNEEIQTMEMTN